MPNPATWIDDPQMFDHELNPLKGWPCMWAIDKTAPVAAVPGGTIQRGSVCSLDIDGAMVLGAPDDAVPLFAFPGAGDYDVASSRGNISGGNIMALVPLNGLEVQTTEYAGAGFDPNVPVQPGTSGNLGKVVAGAYGNGTSICGYVSKAGPYKNDFQKNVVQFWLAFIPGSLNA